MVIPTEPVGSVPRSPELQAAMNAFGAGEIDAATMEAEFDAAVADTVARFVATGSPVISDGEDCGAATGTSTGAITSKSLL